jgi:UDP-3-O-[3-hydroxymyristoyl] glucosamine N-acyltransferase
MIDITARDIQKLIGKANCSIIGNAKRKFKYVQSIYEATPKHLTFCAKKGEEGLSLMEKTNASVIICDKDVLLERPLHGKTLIMVENPRLWFVRCMNHFFPQKQRGIHPSAYINDNVRIGKNVTINAYSVIGSEGFGYIKNEENMLEKFEHVGGVIIKDNVAIGALTTVDRGTLGNTIIGEGAKIDSHVHIGHNVVIGKHCVITAFAMIGGSSKIGNYCWIAPCACIRDGITIGKNVLVGMGAVVTKNVGDSDVVLGVPAKSIKARNE